MIQSSVAATMIFAAFMSSTSAVSVTFQNNCANDVKLIMREGGNAQETSWPLSPQGTTSTSFEKGFQGNFRLGDDDAATLVEFSTQGKLNLVWYDISVIPPQLNPGFEFCTSHEECIANSKSKKGFNMAVQMTPSKNTNGNQCRELTCLDATCSDAYLFPKDDTKTHACLFETDFTVTFCPGENQVPEPTTAATELTTIEPKPETPVSEPEKAVPEPTTTPTVPNEVPTPTVAPDIIKVTALVPPPEPQSPTITPAVSPVPTPQSNDNVIHLAPASAPPQTVLGDDQMTVTPSRDHCE